VIYFVKNPDDGRIKIGQSENVRSRILWLRSTSKANVELLGVMEGSRLLEREIHARFASGWIDGEWFEATPELLAFIAENTKAFEVQIRPKANSAVRSAKLGRKKSDRPSSAALHVRCVPAWIAWVNELAEFEGMDLATLTELAFRDRAKKAGFDPPPRRTQATGGPKKRAKGGGEG
jgi:hypothetical protein